ncbi:hypothetical protein ES332_D10G058800v1 [Gossypium tomentosum]|uniref:Uncharacterized protein n=1 Tax=Gossypium tomentosum TaxID=34277 RepID=A0A5D2J177_GOSTO|nr:hypothetical protein ES332_D10G058800v1 [Gossypium tomentosum]
MEGLLQAGSSYFYYKKPKAERPSPMRRSVRRAFERFLNLAHAPMMTERARISSPGVRRPYGVRGRGTHVRLLLWWLALGLRELRLDGLLERRLISQKP